MSCGRRSSFAPGPVGLSRRSSILSRAPVKPVVEEALETPLDFLLKECDQLTKKLPTLTEMITEAAADTSIKKIGEGTFGEAYKCGEMVFKVMPIEGDLIVNDEEQKRASDVHAEAVIAQRLSDLAESDVQMCPNFVKTHRISVCKGSYGASLLSAWDHFHDTRTSENDRPSEFTDDQLYIAFAFENGGEDLEGFDIQGYEEACSLLLQVSDIEIPYASIVRS